MRKMYKECEYCGAHLDFNEDCDCIAEKRKNRNIRKRNVNNLKAYMEEQDERIAI